MNSGNLKVATTPTLVATLVARILIRKLTYLAKLLERDYGLSSHVF